MFANDIARLLKMPKNHDFSARNANWNNYKKEFALIMTLFGRKKNSNHISIPYTKE